MTLKPIAVLLLNGLITAIKKKKVPTRKSPVPNTLPFRIHIRPPFPSKSSGGVKAVTVLNYPRNSILHLKRPGCEWSFTSDAYLCWLTFSSPADRENCLNLSPAQSAVVKAHFIDQTLIVGATRLTFWSVGTLTLSNEKVTDAGKRPTNRRGTINHLQRN